ncbi:MAG TPA: PmoA family protein [Vicinamibacteria bacterium]|nr:PmoA family protein [Vicinamibacteria bacterium]
MTTRLRWVVLAALSPAVSALSVSADQSPRVEVQSRAADRRVDVLVDGRPFTSYIWPERVSKPVLYPIRTAKGTLVTRGFPLEPRPGERVDHPHQVGYWLTYGDVDGVDYWGNSEAVPAPERAKLGVIRHRQIVASKGGAGRGDLEVLLDWVKPGGVVVLEERTRFAFRADSTSRSIDRVTTLTAKGGTVTFRDTKEGMLGLRVARALEQPADKAEVFTDASGKPTAVPVLDNKGVSGLYTSSEGLKGDAVWGTRARWMALSGRLGDEDVVVLLLDHPKNPGHPTYWHARGYGLFALNPFGPHAYSNGRDPERPYSLENGQKPAFRYRLSILPGPFAAEKAEAAWKAYAAEGEE